MTRLILTLFAFGLSSFINCGCSRTATVYESAELGAIDNSDVSTVVSKQQADVFAAELEAAISSGDVTVADRMILSDRILDRVVEGLSLTGEVESGFRRGMSSSNPVTATLTQLAAAVKDGGSYALVRTAARNGEMHAIFRLIDANQSLNYHDFRLLLDGEKVKADQIFVAATGESFTDTIITAVGPAVRSQQSTMGRVTGEAAEKMKDLEKQSSMMLAARGGEPAKAMKIYETLPAELKNSKAVQLARVIATQSLSDEQYMTSMVDYAKRFPNDPSVALMSFDRAVMKKDVAAVKKCLASLDQWTGGDDYVKLLSATVVSDWGDLQYAKELYTNADPATVGTAAAHDYKLSAALRCQDFEVVLNELRTLRDKYEYDFDLANSPDFADFLKSPQFQEWQAD